jgi:WD40 repeat protein
LLAFSTIPSVDPEVSSLPDYERCCIRLWDSKTEQVVRELPLAGSCFDLEFSEDGRSLVSLSQDSSGSNREEANKITVWSMPDGKELTRFHARSRFVNTETLAISPDKAFAAYIGRGSRRIRLIDLAGGQELWTATANHAVNTLAVSKDSRVLASGEGLDESAIRLWDVESGIEIGCLKGHQSWICDLHFDSGGKTLMSASADQTIRVWDVSDPHNGELLHTFRGHDTEVWRIALLPDNRTLVSGGKDGSVCIWDTHKRPFDIGPVIRANVSSFRFTPDGSGVLIVDRNGCVTRLQGPRFQEECVILNISAKTDYLKTLISPDNRLLAAPLKDGTIEVWELQNGTVLCRIPCRPSTEPIAFLARGTKLVAFERDGGSYLMWDLTTGQHMQSWAGAAKLSPWVSPVCTTDGRLMLTLRFYKVPGVLRDMASGRQTDLNLDITETSGISFSPNGELLAASSHLGFVKLWEAETFKELATFAGFLLGAHSVAFSPDGQRLAAGSDSLEAVKIWDVESLQELLTLPGQGWQHYRAAFSPDGNTLGTMNSSGQLHLWRAPSWEEIERAEASRARKASLEANPGETDL